MTRLEFQTELARIIFEGAKSDIHASTMLEDLNDNMETLRGMLMPQTLRQKETVYKQREAMLSNESWSSTKTVPQDGWK